METKVTTRDLIGDLENFPIEIVEKMLRKQYNQVNKMDVTVFQNNKRADEIHGGFRWSDTIEGYRFWDDVITLGKFDVFFKRYPERYPVDTKSKRVYIRGDVHNGEEVIKALEFRGGINKHDYTGNADALLYFIDPVTNYIVHASKFEEPLLNLLISNYTEITHPKKMVEMTVQEVAEKLGIDPELLRIKK